MFRQFPDNFIASEQQPLNNTGGQLIFRKKVWQQTFGGEHRLAEIILAKFRQYAYNINRTKAAIGSLKAHFRCGLLADRRRRKFRWIEPVGATCVQRCNRGFR
jgi:hypothetical protein